MSKEAFFRFRKSKAVSNPKIKEAAREEIKRKTEEFLKAGGKVEELGNTLAQDIANFNWSSEA